MQSTTRRSSVPATVSTRKTSTTTSSNVKTRPAVQKQSPTTIDSSPSMTSSSTPSSSQSTSTAIVNTSTASTNPMVLTPVSQLPKGSRRNSRAEMTSSDKPPSSWDPEHFNPDGSIRTVHRMPGFEQAYAQAQKARYIRHRNATEKEKELSVNQIFDKS
ncbi:hypothetical protein Btru_051562 [Bulinus truncatus]|nr:hypothetical protein Btru_051562 [Bulinus truncatus]